jgi:hypothetical protein
MMLDPVIADAALLLWKVGTYRQAVNLFHPDLGGSSRMH